LALFGHVGLLWVVFGFGKNRSQLRRSTKLGSGHLSFALSAYRDQDGAAAEENSIRKRDLFGEHVAEDPFELGYDPEFENPFADYPRDLARNIDDPLRLGSGRGHPFSQPQGCGARDYRRKLDHRRSRI
jgi:hypothetical protein